MKRRDVLKLSGVALAAGLVPWHRAIAEQGGDESALIYLSPLKSNGALSRCQAEVWFVQDERDMYVVTGSDAWRAQAVGRGLTRTHVWVGDVGLWQRSDGAYKKLPALTAEASIVNDGAQHARLLQRFGSKYSSEWGTWGPRFRNGLADGSRVMLRYTPV